MKLQDAAIAAMAMRVCESVLGHHDAKTIETENAPTAAVSACIQISGSWCGALLLACTQCFADHSAAKMYSLPVDLCGEVETQNAIAELANVIGEHLKAFLPVQGPCQLSQPTVVSGNDHHARVAGCFKTHQVALDYGGSALIVTIFEKAAAAIAA